MPKGGREILKEEKGPDMLANQADSFGAAKPEQVDKHHWLCMLDNHSWVLRLACKARTHTHTRDFIDTYIDTQTCYSFHDTAKSQAHTPSQSRWLALWRLYWTLWHPERNLKLR